MTARKPRKPRVPTRQSLWMTANRAKGLCGCGRKRLKRTKLGEVHVYGQCARCLSRQRKRRGYRGGRTKFGAGRPPGRRKAAV